MATKCKPSKYNVVSSNKTVTYGWRCARHNIPSKRYASEELRDRRLKEHQKEAKKD